MSVSLTKSINEVVVAQSDYIEWLELNLKDYYFNIPNSIFSRRISKAKKILQQEIDSPEPTNSQI